MLQLATQILVEDDANTYNNIGIENSVNINDEANDEKINEALNEYINQRFKIVQSERDSRFNVN